jgi:hypothetical protein
MTIEPGSTVRERRTAWFIAAAMLAALLYFASQGGLLSGLLNDLQLQEAKKAAVSSQVDFSKINRRTVTLPLSITALSEKDLDSQLRQLHRNAINWVLLRLPVWTPTSRNLEYSSFDMDRARTVIRKARTLGIGVTVAPMFWDGATLSAMPRADITAAFFASYSDMILDVASMASTSGADALLLDALFGAPAVSAAEWVQLISELRAEFFDALEVRMNAGETPLAYLRQFDGVHISPDSAAITRLNSEAEGSRIHFMMENEDSYTSSLEQWKPVLVTRADMEAALAKMLSFVKRSKNLSGFTLSGTVIYEQLTAIDDPPSPLVHTLQRLHEEQIILQLGQRQHELRSGPEK